MKTKQETIDYCMSEINSVERIKTSECDSRKVLELKAIRRTYEDVIRFLKDE